LRTLTLALISWLFLSASSPTFAEEIQTNSCDFRSPESIHEVNLAQTDTSKDLSLGIDLPNESCNQVLALMNGDSIVESDPGCNSSSYSLNGSKWKSAFNWAYNSAGEVSPLSLDRIKDAMMVWQSATNRCQDGSFNTSLKLNFGGPTKVTSSMVIQSDSNSFPLATDKAGKACDLSAHDGINLISWGRLPGDVFGTACTYLYPGTRTIIEADIMFNIAPPFEFYERPEWWLCNYRMQLLINTATHEIGHAIGMSHVSDLDKQIMSSSGQFCYADRVGLAAGDYVGYKTLYEIKSIYVAE